MEALGPALLGGTGRPTGQALQRRCRSGVVAEWVRRDAELCVLTLSGELSRSSVQAALDALTGVLADGRHVVVDVSGLHVTWPSAVQVFASALTAAGGWPTARMVLIGADSGAFADLSQTVPVAPEVATARQLLSRRPPAVARHCDLTADSSAPRRARRFVSEVTRDWDVEPVRDDAALVASELVGNAVTHARTSCRLDMRLDRLGLTIAVRDYDYGGLLVPLTCSTTGHREYGLFLVSSISRAWGVSPTENGKSVWALLPVPDR